MSLQFVQKFIVITLSRKKEQLPSFDKKLYN